MAGMRFHTGLLAAFALLFAACGLEPVDDSPNPPPGATSTSKPANLPACDWARVISVHDGDTIRVSVNDGPYERLRYIGIDAPEVANEGGVAEPFAEESTAMNRELVENQQVCLEKDVSDVDQYGRLLRYVWLADGRMVNEEILRAGLANVVTFRPDTKYHKSRLSPAEASAREREIGIWSE